VTALQSEVTAMAPQVAFYEHRRAVLNVDNNTIKQKMAALAQGQRFKDGKSNSSSKTTVARFPKIYSRELDQLNHYSSPFPSILNLSWLCSSLLVTTIVTFIESVTFR
jgi:hypothetical protein